MTYHNPDVTYEDDYIVKTLEKYLCELHMIQFSGDSIIRKKILIHSIANKLQKI